MDWGQRNFLTERKELVLVQILNLNSIRERWDFALGQVEQIVELVIDVYRLFWGRQFVSLQDNDVAKLQLILMQIFWEAQHSAIPR